MCFRWGLFNLVVGHKQKLSTYTEVLCVFSEFFFKSLMLFFSASTANGRSEKRRGWYNYKNIMILSLWYSLFVLRLLRNNQKKLFWDFKHSKAWRTSCYKEYNTMIFKQLFHSYAAIIYYYIIIFHILHKFMFVQSDF